jgi:hypothetical protein
MITSPDISTLTISCLCSPITKNPAYHYTGGGVGIRWIFGDMATYPLAVANCKT